MLHRALVPALTRWRERCVVDGSTSRGLAHMRLREQSRGWNAWAAAWLEAGSTKAKMRRSVLHMLNRGLSRGWRSWVSLVGWRDAQVRSARSRTTSRSQMI